MSGKADLSLFKFKIFVFISGYSEVAVRFSRSSRLMNNNSSFILGHGCDVHYIYRHIYKPKKKKIFPSVAWNQLCVARCLSWKPDKGDRIWQWTAIIMILGWGQTTQTRRAVDKYLSKAGGIQTEEEKKQAYKTECIEPKAKHGLETWKKTLLKRH